MARVYDGNDRRPNPIGTVHEDRETMQSAHPRDFDALLLVVGLFAILLVVSLTIGSPAIR